MSQNRLLESLTDHLAITTGFKNWLGSSILNNNQSAAWWFTTPKDMDGAMALNIRPTGIVYEDRQKVVTKLLELSRVAGASFRFSFEMRKTGPVTGGMEIFAHHHQEGGRIRSRLSMAMDGKWAVTDEEGVLVGSLGFVPKEVSHHLRTLMINHPYSVPYYQLCKDTEHTLSISIILLIWKLDSDYMRHLKLRFATDYEEAAHRTNLLRWDRNTYKEAKLPANGYGGLE